MTTNEQIGQRIKERRTALGMSQTELANKLGYRGKSMISLIESGKRSLYAWQIAPLCVILDCTVEDLVDGGFTEHDELIEFVEGLATEDVSKALAILKAAFGGEKQ